MKAILKVLSFMGLLLSILPPVLFFLGKIDMSTNTRLLTIGMLLWFGSAPFWINNKTENHHEDPS